MLKTIKQIADDNGKAERLAVVALQVLGIKPDATAPHAGMIARYYGEEAQKALAAYLALPRAEKLKLRPKKPRKPPRPRITTREQWTYHYLGRQIGCTPQGAQALLRLHGYRSIEDVRASSVSLDEMRTWYSQIPGETPFAKGRALFSLGHWRQFYKVVTKEKLAAAQARHIAKHDLSVWATRAQAAEFLGKNDTTTYALYKQAGFRFLKDHAVRLYNWEDLRTLKAALLSRKGNISSLAELVLLRLQHEGIEFTTEKTFPDLIADKKPLRFDYCLPDLKVLIEVQGPQHFSELFQGFSGTSLPLAELQRRDMLKREYAKAHGWDLLWVTSQSDVGDVIAYLAAEPTAISEWPVELVEDYGVPSLSRYDGNAARFCWLHRGHLPYHRAGMDLKRIHKSYWSSSVSGGKSPYTTWSTRREAFYRLVENRLRYHPALQGENAYNSLPTLSMLLAGFGIAKISPPASFFAPSFGESLIHEFASDVGLIVDPFSGFSGRMLAAHRAGKAYVGFDVSAARVQEAQEVIQHYGMASAAVEQADASAAIFHEYEDAALLTCPPYGDKESWDGVVGFENEDYWIKQVLLCYGCKRYIFVVGETSEFTKFETKQEPTRKHPFYTKGSRKLLIIERDARDKLVGKFGCI